MIVAIESEITPKKQSTIPIAFNLSGTLAFIIRIRPINPITKPSNPMVLSFSLKKSQRKIVIINGSILAMVAARLASIHCIATKFRPK